METFGLRQYIRSRDLPTYLILVIYSCAKIITKYENTTPKILVDAVYDANLNPNLCFLSICNNINKLKSLFG